MTRLIGHCVSTAGIASLHPGRRLPSRAGEQHAACDGHRALLEEAAAADRPRVTLVVVHPVIGPAIHGPPLYQARYPRRPRMGHLTKKRMIVVALLLPRRLRRRAEDPSPRPRRSPLILPVPVDRRRFPSRRPPRSRSRPPPTSGDRVRHLRRGMDHAARGLSASRRSRSASSGAPSAPGRAGGRGDAVLHGPGIAAFGEGLHPHRRAVVREALHRGRPPVPRPIPHRVPGVRGRCSRRRALRHEGLPLARLERFPVERGRAEATRVRGSARASGRASGTTS